LGLSVLLVVLIVLYAEQIIMLLFGTAFVGAAPLLNALSPIITMYVMNPYLSTLLIASHREGVVTRIAFTNLALACVLFPSAVIAGGALSLAVASVVVELSGHVQTLIAVKRLLTISRSSRIRRRRP
jgi:O-antigen/teichoic acid export membrane protein